MKRIALFFVVLSFLCFAVSAQEKKPEPKPPSPFDILTPEFGYKDDPTRQFPNYLWDAAKTAKEEWLKRYETVKNPEQAAAYQQERINGFLKAIGQFPERTPLNARITKTHQKEGYRVEMVVLETQPNFYLTGAMFLPDDPKWKAPYPVMLVVCGHSDLGKGSGIYNRTCALAALNGVASFIIDPIDQGERHQLLKKDGKAYSTTVPAHNLLDPSSIAVGRSAAHFMIWDMMRAIDYLESRPEIDSKRIGAAGNSGGGTQTSYIMVLDPRVAVAAPSCYLCSLYGRQVSAPQDAEQNIFGQLGFYMDHADYVMMRAPRPTLMCTATRDAFAIEDSWLSFRMAKRFYDRFNASEKVSLIETDEPHGWSKHLREATVRWMVRWFYDRNVDITEPESLQELSKEEQFCLDEKEVLKLDGAISTFDLNRNYEKTLKPQRQERWKNGLTDELRNDIRRLIVAKKLSEIPKPTVETKGSETKVSPFGIECRMERFVMKPEPLIELPILRLTPTQQSAAAKPILVLHGSGKSAALSDLDGNVERLLKEGRTVILADLRGLGEMQFTGAAYFIHKHHGIDGTAFYLSYLLGKTCVGMRTEDLLNIARWMKADAAQGIDVYAYGLPGTVAVHAAALEPSLFNSLEVEASLTAWADIVEAGICYHPNTDLVHGALLVYDIPNLVEVLGSKLTFRNSINAQGKPSGTPIEFP
ncbi:MAG: hypothetical protein FWE67_11410 [Planctomycetaceae bacterium]|nr:hypothetical protein [Planctomycetaceae bacterium]